MEVFTTQLIAQEVGNPVLPDALRNLSGPQFFGNLIPALISFGLVIGVIIFVFFLVWGGIQWISSGGDKGQMEQARSKIFNALVGIIILLSFFAILNLVECFFGFGLRQLEVGPYNISFTSGLNCGGGGGYVPACEIGQHACYDENGDLFCVCETCPCPI